MQALINEKPDRRVPRKDNVILHFNKLDSRIVRSWSGSKTKDIFDDKN